MIEFKRAIIKQELFSRPGIKGFTAFFEGKEEPCIAYPELVGEIEPGQEVLINTTAQTLGLGTGGYHYVIANLDAYNRELQPGGHIMKLRYTPLQLKVLSVEEEDSPHHGEMVKADSLEGIPVLVGTLHSMLAPLCIYLRDSGIKIVYVMTDGAALPISFSNNVEWLKQAGLLETTVTTGHSFGGDLEAVNIYSGMLAARKVAGADLIIVAMGPGIVGTGTRWGFSGVEQGEILNAVDTLGGKAIAIPRISFADSRVRHRGISHHTLTVLSRICRVNAIVPLPQLERDKMDLIMEQLFREKIIDRYRICLEDGTADLRLLEESGLKMTTMGRGLEAEKEFFLTLAACARTARRLINGEELQTIGLA
ncbi:MAG: DUF3866 family protein [Syntrophomonadaceae bacterium]|nr:DUF3866 family protein [Syntrophomonadaceae bacterium]